MTTTIAEARITHGVPERDLQHWLTLADALIEKGLGDRVFADRPLSFWRSKLAPDDSNRIAMIYAMGAVETTAADFAREALGIEDLEFIVLFKVRQSAAEANPELCEA